MTQNEYAEGFSYGVDWAVWDRRDHITAAAEVSLLQAEAVAAERVDSRALRAFYLGALRGYRSVARTLKAGRWGL